MPVCTNCGGETPDDARFCPRCGALQKEGHGTHQLSFAHPRARESWDVCEIGWWRGYVKSEFYASAISADGAEYEVGRSPQFRWHHAGLPPYDHAGARAAHESLVEQLSAAGWEPLGGGIPWFATRFRRLGTGLRLLQPEPPRGSPDEEGSAEN